MTAADPTTQPAATVASVEADLFAAPAPPENFDPKWAHAKLSEIPNDPPAPPIGKAEAPPELPRQALRHLTEAQRLFGEQRYSETVAEAEQVIRYNPSNVEPNRLAAIASLMVGKDEQAKQYATAAIAIRPDDLTSHYILARIADKAEQAQPALAQYRTALKCPAESISASYKTLTRYHLGLLLRDLGFYQASITQLVAFQSDANALGGTKQANAELAAVLKLKRLPVLQALADAYEALGQFGPAADALAGAAQYVPDDAAVQVRQIKDLVRAGRFDDAAARAGAYADATQANAKAVALLLAVHRASGHPDRGVAALRRLTEQSPDNIPLALAYADALITSKRYDQAVQLLEGVVGRHSDASGARWTLVAIHRFRGDLDRWLWSLAGELALNPTGSIRAFAELDELAGDKAASLLQAGLKESTAPAAETSEHETATYAARLLCLARLADRLDRVEDARALYARSLQVDGNFMPAVAGIAELYIRRCEWDKALAILKPTESEEPFWQDRLNQLMGRCHDGLDQFPEAVSCYEKSIAVKPDDVDALLLLARIYERTNRPKQAERLYEKIAAAAPDRVDARELLVVNLLNRWNEGDNLKQAIAELTEMQKQSPESPATIRATALIRVLLRNQDLAGYAKALAALVENHPKDAASRQTLCMALYRTGDYEAVLRELEPLLTASPCDSEANELRVTVLLRELRVDEAAERLGQCLKWYPNRERFLRSFAEVSLVRQDYPKAASLWEQLLSYRSNEDRYPLYRRRLIITCLQAGWYDRARTWADKWLTEASDVAAYRAYLLAADASEGNYDAYLKRCREWLEKDSNDQQAREWLLGIGELPGQAKGGLIAAGRPGEAVVRATTWAAESPGETSYQQMLLETLKAVRRSQDAIELCRAELTGADKLPQQLAALQSLAEAYLQAKQYDRAIATVKELGARGSKITEADLGFGMDQLLVSYFTQAKRFTDAVTLANKLIADLDERDAQLEQVAAGDKNVSQRLALAKEQERLRQQKSMVLRTLGFVYTKQNSTEQAVDCLRQAIKLTPGDAGINNDLGYTLADAGLDLHEAETMLRRAVAEVIWLGVGEDDRQAAFCDSLGWLYYKQGRFVQARQWLELSSKMEDGEDPVIYDHLGDAEWRTDKLDEARRAWRKCLQLQEQQVASGKGDWDTELVERVNAKLAASKGEGKPAVATSVAD